MDGLSPSGCGLLVHRWPNLVPLDCAQAFPPHDGAKAPFAPVGMHCSGDGGRIAPVLL